MSNKVYKYFSANVIDLVFARPGFCGIKCSLPKDYNDPYELFLGVDLTVTPDLLAAYRELINELPQQPTSCFSKSPIVTPMWAHYGDNHSGFVVEFDVKALQSAFPEIIIKDVTYRTGPSDSIASQLQMAVGTKKPRHTYFLQQTVLSSAYFSKDVAWSYEQECRLLDQESYCEEIGGHRILQVPIACCTALIIGKNATTSSIGKIKDIARRNNLCSFSAIIGKSTAEPFLANDENGRFVFNGTEIVPTEKVCERCAEPINPGNEYCPWCTITADDEYNAAISNPMRMLDRYGLLDGYYKGLEEIARSRRNK